MENINIQLNLTAGPHLLPHLIGQAGTSAMAPCSLEPGRREAAEKRLLGESTSHFSCCYDCIREEAYWRWRVCFVSWFKRTQSTMLESYDSESEAACHRRKEKEMHPGAPLAFPMPLSVQGGPQPTEWSHLSEKVLPSSGERCTTWSLSPRWSQPWPQWRSPITGWNSPLIQRLLHCNWE